MLKKDVLGKASAKSLGDVMKCGECLHHKQHAKSSFGTVCSQLEVKAYAIAPKCFTPDVTQLTDSPEALVQLLVNVESYSSKQKRILRAMLVADSRKGRLPIGRKVYFLAVGKDYISNYLSGYVLQYTTDNQIVVGGSPEQKSRGKMFTAYFSDHDSLLTYPKWKEHREYLMERGRTVDPSFPLSKRKKVDVDHEPPTLDTAPASFHDKRDADEQRKVKRSSRNSREDMTINLRQGE